uniref:Retrotransposon gag domain-containing protein n=1 Tax=Populus alba TaxID=43335 RepID=A0A4V6A5P6_POPAL|nr:hypothetical protein D5086_0000225710 [Populus alba]
MGTNKERIEQLEIALGEVQDGLHRMEIHMADRHRQMEETLNRLSDVLLANQAPAVHGNQHREGHEGGRQIVSSKSAKLEFPRFSGDDPTEWFNRVNQFFEFQNTAETQKVSLASYHLEGEANQWWQWIRRNFQDEGRAIAWVDFEDELWARFGPSECENFDETLSRIRQTGSLREYQREFERLGNRVRGWTQRALVGTFMGGLRTDISDGIRMFKPQTLKDAISFARMKDDQLMRQRKFIRPTPSVRTPLALPPSTSTSQVTPIRRLSWDEMQRRRLQGLCFNCNERFTAGHKCQGAKLLMLESHAEDEEAVDDDIHNKYYAAEHLEESVEPAITLHALTGWTAPKTMRVTARIGTHAIFTLIDSGSTHNFISERMANLLRLPVVSTKAFTVRVANGENLKCQEKFNAVQVDLQGSIFSLTLYSLPLTGLDLVLGIQWLELLGSVVCNWKQLTMEFFWANKARRLEGIDGQEIKAATFKEISKDVCSSGAIYAFCLQITMQDMHDETAAPIHTELPPVADDGVVILEPHSILDTRWIKHGGQLVEESLVHWQHLSQDDATWEPTEQLFAQFSPSILEDKDNFRGGSNDRPRRSARGLKPNLKYL